jgi:hypothetical protein
VKTFLTSVVHALLFHDGTRAGPACPPPHSFQYKYHYPKVKIQPPVLHAVLGDLNPLFLDDKG